MSVDQARVATLSMNIEIAAPATVVWRALTEDIGKWWPADFYAGGTEGQRSYKMEALPGGRMFESWNEGGGVLWGTVVCVDPDKRLQVIGSLFPSFGGPSQWYGTWDLDEKDSGETVLTFSESSVGKVSSQSLEEKEKGWLFVWNNLKAHVEGNPAASW